MAKVIAWRQGGMRELQCDFVNCCYHQLTKRRRADERMATGAATAGDGRQRATAPPWARPIAARVALAALTAVALTTQAAWDTPGILVARRAAEFLLGALIWEASMLLLVRLVRWRTGPARFAASPAPLACAVVLASVPATAGMAAVVRLAGDHVSSVPSFYTQSLLLGLVLTFARRGLLRGWASRPAATVAGASPVPPHAPPRDPARAFLDRHAPSLASHKLLALEGEDHYLRVHTDGGSALVLMRLRDAVAALGDSAGWQPHRSFWLAAGATARAERSGQSWRLLLPTGLAVPVSRANLAAMRAAGYGTRN